MASNSNAERLQVVKDGGPGRDRTDDLFHAMEKNCTYVKRRLAPVNTPNIHNLLIQREFGTQRETSAIGSLPHLWS